MSKRRRMMNTIKTLPAIYRQVEYIQSTGTQYIDTGVVGNQNIDIDITLKVLENTWQYVIGARKLAPYDDNQLTIGGFQGGVLIYKGLSGRDNIVSYTNSAYISNYKNNIKISGFNCYVNDELKTITPSTFSPVYNLMLFAINANGPISSSKSKVRLFDCVIKNNGVIIRDFIPCYRITDGVAGLYDYVTKAFFANNGTGEFLLGPEDYDVPNDYEKVEYIESHGTEYIDTGIIANQNTSIEVCAQRKEENGYQAIYGSRTSSSLNRYDLVINTDEGIAYRGYATSTTTKTTITGNNNIYKSSKNSFYFNGLLCGTIESATFTTPNAIKVFATDTNGDITYNFKGRIFYFKMWDDTTLVAHYIPVMRISDNEYGMYDLVTEQFISNGGTGSFTGGN